MTINLRALPAVLLAVAASTSACSRADMLASLEAGPAAEVVLIGDGQTADAGSELPEPVTVQVLDAAGRPVEGQLVKFIVIEGGGEVFAGAAMTNDQGIAREWWTLGEVPGLNRLEVQAMDSLTGVPTVVGSFLATGS
jgi:hypothetical protein